MPGELAAVLGQGLVLVEEEPAGEITGSVRGTFDGMRGWVRRLATRPDRRGRGIATGLLTELERRLRGVGCRKVNLLIEPGHAAVASFYAGVGYRQDDLLFMEKRLAAEPAAIVPNGPAPSPPVPAVTAGGWHGIEPDLAPDQYVRRRGRPTRPGCPGRPGPRGAAGRPAWRPSPSSARTRVATALVGACIS